MKVSEKDDGFTLLEVVVAVAILAIALGALFPIFGAGLGRVKYSNQRADAVALAETKLLEVLAIGRWDELPKSGEDGVFQWAISRIPVFPEGVEGPITIQVVLVEKNNEWYKPVTFNRIIWGNG